MSSHLSTVEARLPPGFRFHPRDDELVCDYLAPSKLDRSLSTPFPMMIDVNLNKCEPWDLPDTACVGSKGWYFFNLRDRKYATGQRTNRATTSGYWKATGKDRHVVREGTPVGTRKTLVFYQGRAPEGRKTDWVMHEFRSEGRGDPPPGLISGEEDWVLCRVFCKSRSRTGVYSSKPSTEGCCYEDTVSSSLPPPADAACSDVGLNHRQSANSFPPLRPPPSTTAGAASLVQQVPCFSNCHHQIVVVPTVGTNCKSYSMDHLASTCFESVLDQLSKDGRRRDEVGSSGSYLSTGINGDISSSTWFPNFES